MVDDASRAAVGEGVRLRLGVVATALAEVLPTAARRLREDGRGLRVTVAEGKTAALVASVRAGALDVAVVHLPLHRGDDLPTRVLREDPVGVALPADWPEARDPAELRLADLAERPWVLFPRDVEQVTYDRYAGACVSAGFAPRVAQEAQGLPTLLALTAGGVGAAFVARSVARAGLRHDVVWRPLADGPTLTLGVVWRDEVVGLDVLLDLLDVDAHQPT